MATRRPRGQTPAQQRAPDPAATPAPEGKATKGDTAALKAKARAREREERAAFEAGKSGSGSRDAYDGDGGLQMAFDAGVDERIGARPTPSGNPRQRTRIGPTGQLEPSSYKPPAFVSDGAGVVVGMIAYALVLAYIRYGPDGPKSWLSAKFINKPTIGPLKGGGIYVPSPPGPPPSGAPVPGQNPTTGQTPAPPGWHLVQLPNGSWIMQGP